ncbi:hypothetical protein HPB49_005466 [Dermacentor silvarum]|uniref:Uncharacterized protein n=1 Tax=Dermacentor silvarum TaxID=543639 RepID=A0ACB8DWC4_DERSI|nr:hypothetical protein HPB49_005466 [Dermacentor silvarum]
MAEEQVQPGTGDAVPARGVKYNQGMDDEGNDMQQDDNEESQESTAAEHSVEMYGLAPDDAVKGVIHGVPTRLTIQEIKENIMEDGFEIYTVKRMGKDSTTVILTFAGPDVPHYLWLYGAEYRCTLHKKTVPVCWVCYEVGHRSTVCPRPGTRACQGGMRDPAPGHTCVAKCTLCGGKR